mmetsp:Transcript_24250/g.37392  ORF Transcript_24250/g.37392 Transcript_24250/m.37392 type:complete len:90 (+) Transcript_24250:3148-3417(+)
MILIETRNFEPILIFIYVFNILMMPLVASFNDGLQSSYYYKMQFDVVLKMPTFWFAVALVTALGVLPRYAYKCIYHSVWYPEFNKIKVD